MMTIPPLKALYNMCTAPHNNNNNNKPVRIACTCCLFAVYLLLLKLYRDAKRYLICYYTIIGFIVRYNGSF